ncbi:MAG: P1 family peptidase, partial [Fulvivirga sp.]|nr:P1 family peptidase [Fulvivirga sp.]
RAILGLARTGGIMSHGSGDYVIAFSTAETLRIPYESPNQQITVKELRDTEISLLFQATIEATEEAIINSLLSAETMAGNNGLTIEALPIEEIKEILSKYKLKD